MTYYQAAVKVLRSAQRPLTTREVADRALTQGLITPVGKRPHATMGAVLTRRAQTDPELVRIDERASNRAKRGSVRWTLRKATAASPVPRA
jgi:HB1, ASXL, restriction endonuclease HTH domain